MRDKAVNGSQSPMNLVLGTAQFRPGYGLPRGLSRHAERSPASMLEAAARVGVVALDTAPVYGEAENEIRHAGCTLPIHTKIDHTTGPATSLARSLERLGRTRVDVLYVHSSAEVMVKQSPVLAAAASLVGSRVGRLGVSVYEVEEFQAALADPRITVVQAPLNLFDRRFSSELLSEAASAGINVYVRSMLLQGVLTSDPNLLRGSVDPLRPYVAAFDELARRVGRTRIDLALGWVKAFPGIKGAVFGADSIDQILEIAGAFQGPALEDDVVAELNGLPVPPWELADPRRWSAGPAR